MVRLQGREAEPHVGSHSTEQFLQKTSQTSSGMVIHCQVHTRENYLMIAFFLNIKSSFNNNLGIQAIGWPTCYMHTAETAVVVAAVLNLQI